jgi:hypothetical protein
MMRALANMFARNAPSRLMNDARALAVRVTGSIEGETNFTTPRNSRPGNPLTVSTTCCPART